MGIFDTSDISSTGLTVVGVTVLSGDSTGNILTVSGRTGAILTITDNVSSTLFDVSTTGGTSLFRVTDTGVKIGKYIYDSSATTGTTGQVLSTTATGVTWTTGGSGSGTSGTSGNGTAGTSGTKGTSGTSGANGSSGTSGANGTSGSSGTSGNGTSGSSGTSGNGTSGSSGTSGVSTTTIRQVGLVTNLASAGDTGTINQTHVGIGYSGTITGWYLTCYPSSSVTIDVWKVSAGVPTVANTITGSAKPSVTTARLSSGSTLTGWNTTVNTGDYFMMNVDSNTAAQYINLQLIVSI